MGMFALLFAALIARLFHLQIVRAGELQTRAQTQWTSESVVSPRRGAIVDRNGELLAVSATAYTASASPRQVEQPEAFARILSPVLDLTEEQILKKISDRSKGGVVLKRQISREIAQELKTLLAEHRAASSKALSGLYLEEESKRFYPMGEFAEQLLGLTTIDGVGQSGLEASLNKYLSGKAGLVLDEIDGKGRALPYSASEYVPAVAGAQAELTIDYVIQSFAEQAAREAMEVNSAKGVRVLVMNPKTGEILAMCTKPDYDPNNPPRSDVDALTDLMRNRCVTDAYEPGSTFKILTAAAALDAGVTNPGEGFYCSGKVTVDGSTIHCWGRPHGAQSMAKALCNSCNPVFVELGLRLGTDRLYDYLEAFGLGKATGVDISGEAGGILIARERLKRVDLARVGFGQSVAVTPIQLLSAACSVVNGGNLMRPYVVKRIVAESGEVLLENAPEVRAHPIREETSKTMRGLLEKVVEEGGGHNAYIEGYRIGGKTGTAQVYVDGVVSSSTHIGSFIGFAPIDEAQVAVMVIVDEAHVPSDFGSITAAPFARDVLEKTLSYLGCPKNEAQSGPQNLVEIPDATGMKVAEAVSLLKKTKLKCLLSGAGAEVIRQFPLPGAQVAEGSVVMLYAEGVVSPSEQATVEVPDVSGLSVAEAGRIAGSCGLTLRVDGSGVAVYQNPPAGALVYAATTLTVTFQTPGTS